MLRLINTALEGWKMSMTMMVGNIGSGKSLLASKFAKMGHVVVNMDSIQKMVGGGEYGLYDNKKKDVYRAAETTIIETALKNGFSVVVDRTNMDRKRRARFIEIGKKYAREIIAYDWGQGSSDGLTRRLKAPNGVPQSIWQDVHSYMASSYEKPSLDEGFSSIVDAPKKFKFYAFDFDGTIVKNKFPDIGEILDGTVETINRLWQNLSNIIIVWSCRSEDFENQMRDFLLKNKIPFDFINENPMFDTGSKKIFAHEYFDDRNVFYQC